jgi:hypothetical protein
VLVDVCVCRFHRHLLKLPFNSKKFIFHFLRGEEFWRRRKKILCEKIVDDSNRFFSLSILDADNEKEGSMREKNSLSNNRVMRCQKSSISTALSETGFQAG